MSLVWQDVILTNPSELSFSGSLISGRAVHYRKAQCNRIVYATSTVLDLITRLDRSGPQSKVLWGCIPGISPVQGTRDSWRVNCP